MFLHYLCTELFKEDEQPTLYIPGAHLAVNQLSWKLVDIKVNRNFEGYVLLFILASSGLKLLINGRCVLVHLCQITFFLTLPVAEPDDVNITVSETGKFFGISAPKHNLKV